VKHSTYDELADALLRSSRALVGVAARSLADVDDVTLPQFRALVLVSGRARTSVADLAAALGVHSTTATRLCDRLVRKRLMRRLEAADDRRETLLQLSANGRRLVERVTERRREDLSAIAKRMGRDDAVAAVVALEAFAAASGAAATEADLFGWDACQSRPRTRS
jgi:DNA-binding MarR family transcriptional regulator